MGVAKLIQNFMKKPVGITVVIKQRSHFSYLVQKSFFFKQIVFAGFNIQKTDPVFHFKGQITRKTPVFVDFLQIHESKLSSLIFSSIYKNQRVPNDFSIVNFMFLC